MNTTTEPNTNLITRALQIDKKLTNEEFAQLAGFTPEEIKKIEIYWDPLFNHNWIYLSEDMILENLTNEQSKHAITNFYNRNLIPNYIEGTDYQLVTIAHEVVQFWCSFSKTKKSDTRGGSNKKYYMVTGDTYKHLLMSAKTEQGRQTRLYFLKIERTTIAMKDYLFSFSQREMQRTIENLSYQQRQIEHQAKSASLIKTYNNKRVVYVGCIKEIDGDQMIVKYGCTRAPLQNTVNRHQHTYNLFYFLFMIECDKHDLLERQIQSHSDLLSRHVSTYEGKTHKELLRLDKHFTIVHLEALINNLVTNHHTVISPKLALEQEKTKQNQELTKQNQELTKQKQYEFEMKKIEFEMMKFQSQLQHCTQLTTGNGSKSNAELPVNNYEESVNNDAESVDNDEESVDNDEESVDNDEESVDNDEELVNNYYESVDNDVESVDNDVESDNNDDESDDNDEESDDNDEESVDNTAESVNNGEPVNTDVESEEELIDNDVASINKDDEFVDNNDDGEPVNDELVNNNDVELDNEELVENNNNEDEIPIVVPVVIERQPRQYWTPEEDAFLRKAVTEFTENNQIQWRKIYTHYQRDFLAFGRSLRALANRYNRIF